MHYLQKHFIAILILFAISTFSLGAQELRIRPSCPMNIIIAVDFSGSELAYVDQIRRVLVDITGAFELDEANLKIGVITFNRGAQLILPLSSDTYKMDEIISQLTIARMVYATDIHSSIDMAYQQFRLLSEPGIPKYFVLISDGDPHAHARGFGFQEDLESVKVLKSGNSKEDLDPIHVFTIYTGSLSPLRGYMGERVRNASVKHMKDLASDQYSFFYFNEYPALVEFFKERSICP